MSAVPLPAPRPAVAARNAYIDTLRGWSIFGVVCIHFAGSFVTTDAHAWSPSFWLGLTLNQVFSFAVPLFAFLAGLLSFSSKKSDPTLGEYYRRRLVRIGLPYLVASIAAFFLLNHYPTWLALPNAWARVRWLLEQLFYFGVEPTFYFMPLILALYLLQPALRALPRWLNRLVPAVSPARFALIVTGLLLVLHVSLSVLCYRNTLNYYTWGRPDPLFWMFYFFAGIHFRTLKDFVSLRTVKTVCGIALLVACSAMTWNLYHLADRSVVGEHFELNVLDLAYVRPEIALYNLAAVLAMAAGLALGWSPRAGVVSYYGRFTLEVNLWHILVLYYGAWRYADTMDSCRQMPELILVICAATVVVVGGLNDAGSRLVDFVRQHRLILVKVA